MLTDNRFNRSNNICLFQENNSKKITSSFNNKLFTQHDALSNALDHSIFFSISCTWHLIMLISSAWILYASLTIKKEWRFVLSLRLITKPLNINCDKYICEGKFLFEHQYWFNIKENNRESSILATSKKSVLSHTWNAMVFMITSSNLSGNLAL